MEIPLYTSKQVQEETLKNFSNHLEEYASSLSDREYQILINLIMNVMDPLERMRWRNADSLLDQKENEYLLTLQKQFDK